VAAEKKGFPAHGMLQSPTLLQKQKYLVGGFNPSEKY
jgi:hypothetical protein